MNGFLFHFSYFIRKYLSQSNWKLTSTTLLIQTLETTLEMSFLLFGSWWMQHNAMRRPTDFCYSLIIIKKEDCILLFFSCLMMRIAMEMQSIALIWFGHLVLWNRRLQSTQIIIFRDGVGWFWHCRAIVRERFSFRPFANQFNGTAHFIA